MKITPVTAIGSNRPLCTTKIRIAAGLATHEARRQVYKRSRLGVPVDQCAARSDFMLDGEPTCRPHASAAALAHFLEGQTNER